jgi:hypothetical protein
MQQYDVHTYVKCRTLSPAPLEVGLLIAAGFDDGAVSMLSCPAGRNPRNPEDWICEHTTQEVAAQPVVTVAWQPRPSPDAAFFVVANAQRAALCCRMARCEARHPAS